MEGTTGQSQIGPIGHFGPAGALWEDMRSETEGGTLDMHYGNRTHNHLSYHV